MLKALIITLPKPSKDLSSPQNFSTISLLNHVLKLFAKGIANMTIAMLPYLIWVHKRETNRRCYKAFNQSPSLCQSTGNSFSASRFGSTEGIQQNPLVISRTDPTEIWISSSYLIWDNGLLLQIFSPSFMFSAMLSNIFSMSNNTHQGCPLSPLVFNHLPPS